MSREIEEFVATGELLPPVEPTLDLREAFMQKVEELLRGLKPEVSVTREDGMETLVQATIRKLVVPSSMLTQMDQELRDFAQKHQQVPMVDELPLEIAQSEMLVSYKDKRELEDLRKAGFEIVTILDDDKPKEYASFGKEVRVKLLSPFMGLSSLEGDPLFSWTYELRQPYNGRPFLETDFNSFYDLPNSLRYTGSHVSRGANDNNFSSFALLLNNARNQTKEIGSGAQTSQ